MQGQGSSLRTVEAGGEMHEALRQAGDYPAEFLDTLETGEMTGQVTESMTRISAEYRRRAEAALRILALIGGVLIFVAVAMMIGGLIIFMFMQIMAPTYELLEEISQNVVPSRLTC